MLKSKNLASKILGFATLSSLTLGLYSTPAFAQEDEEAAAIEEVVVTGSRLKRSDYNSSVPLTVVSGQALLDQGMNNLGEALRNQVSIGTGGFNQSSILSGGGSSSIDLRNLGPDRVLILINGRRVASFADALANQAADLTFVPTAMVDRVEILRDGASAVYGSDAITGVVNVILKDDFEGIEITANTGASTESDGETWGSSLTMGTSFDRGNFVMGVEVRDQQPIKQVDRGWAFPSISSLSATGFNNGSFFSPGGVWFDNNGSLPGSNFGVLCTEPKAFGGDEVTLQTFPDCPSYRQAADRNDLARYDYGLAQDLIVDSKVISTSAYGNYQLTDNVNVFLEMQYAKRETTSHLDGNPGSFGTPTFPSGSTVPATNPNLPAGSLGGVFYFRPSSTIGPRTSDNESDTIRIVTGVEGEIPEELWFREGWFYEASYLYTKVDANLQTNSTWNLARFIRISDPDLCAADQQCSQVVNASGALDVIRPGNWTENEISYMRQRSSALSEFETKGWSAIISGPLFELPAGEVSMAFGLEYRDEYGFNKPDSVTEAGESVANQVFTTEGSFDIEEYFLEFEIPLLADVFLAQNLSVNLQYRDSDYSNFGSEDVYRVGVNWQVTDDFRIRANSSTAYRAPTVTDLFGGGTVSFDFFTDPCVGPAAGSNEFQNCVLAGLDPTTFAQISAQYPVLSGSNPALEPESADTYTIGFVYQPSWAEGLSIAFDVWDIEVADLITRNTSDSVLDACYAGPVGLTEPECSQFQGRQAGTGIPVNFVNRLANSADGVETDGFDLGVDYSWDWFSNTFWNVSLAGTYIDENTFYPGAGGADDRGSIPRVQANLATTVNYQNWDVTWNMRYISGMDDPRYDGNNPFNYSGTDSYDKHDLRVSYSWDSYRVLLGVNNVFDEDPEYVFSSGNNTDTFLYDVVGRYWFLRFKASM